MHSFWVFENLVILEKVMQVAILKVEDYVFLHLVAYLYL